MVFELNGKKNTNTRPKKHGTDDDWIGYTARRGSKTNAYQTKFVDALVASKMTQRQNIER